jgi:hypothetical protein
VTAILSAPLAWVSLIVGLASVHYDLDVLSPDGHSLIAAGTEAARLIRLSLLLNMFGNYLLLTPLTFFLWYWLRPKSPLFTNFYTWCGLLYILLGAIGSAILSSVWPSLMIDYTQASASQREMLTLVFNKVRSLAEGGFQSLLQDVLAGIWFLGIGLLIRSERRMLGYFTVVLGFLLLLNGLGVLVEHDVFTLIGLTGNLLLAPLWALWLGITLLRWQLRLARGDDAVRST